MKKWLAALLVVFLLISPQKTGAHTGLEKSTPAADSTVKDGNVKFKLTFETEIEDLSRIRVADENGKEVSLMKMGAVGYDLVGESENPLPNGTYTVYWKIIGEDSHVIQGSYKFNVDDPNGTKEEPSASPAKEKNESKVKSESSEKQNDAPMLSPFFYVFLVLAALAVLLGYVLGKRRNK